VARRGHPFLISNAAIATEKTKNPNLFLLEVE
jgi:hypothetical protein